MKNILLLFILLVPAFLFAQYPATGNKQRLGYQTTGDGLIWRGVAGDTVNKPNNRNYPYFQLDTVNGVLYRYIQTRGQWQLTSLDIDSLVYATRYWVNSNFFPLEGGTLTGTGGAGFVGFPSQVVAPGTPASGLNVYAQGSSFNWKGTDGFERLFASTLTGGRTYTLPDVSGTFALGTGATDRSARWSATNTLAAGNFTDNGTKLQALLPFQLHQWTTAGRPTGVTGYEGYNTTGNGKEWYNGTRWAYALESTFARGTDGRILFPDANGQIAESSNLYWNNTRARLGVSNSNPEAKIHTIETGSSLARGTIFQQQSNDVNASVARLRKNRGSATSALLQGDNVGALFFDGNDGTDYEASAAVRGQVDSIVSNNNVPIALEFLTGKSTSGLGYRMRITSGGRIGIGGFFAPSYILDINSTDALRLPRGTTAQTPTEANGIIRYNSDSTAYQGYAGGARVYFATRAYARSLASSAADGNGIYTGSGTLSQHTTRALIPETGNLFFSQKFNSNADSAYFNIVNYGDGERGVNFGLTDTSSTGYSRGYFESDGAGSMNWRFETNDVNGSTTVRALDGELDFITTAGNISLSAPVDQEITVQGLVRAKQEAYYEINSTSSPQNLSNTYSDNFINQGGTQATFTLVFPASPEDGQILKITYNNNISTLTLDGNGNTIVGTTVTTAVEGSQRVFKFYAGEGVWIRQN